MERAIVVLYGSDTDEYTTYTVYMRTPQRITRLCQA